MKNKTYKITMSQPIPAYDVSVTYSKVKKPSGISYILLELINNSSDVDGYFTDVLKQFGIPDDLHHIFENEMRILLRDKIVAFKYRSTVSVAMKALGLYKVSDFVLTDVGKKMFTGGAIPTGETKPKTIDLACVDVVARRFSRLNESLKNYENSELTYDKDLYDRIHAGINKNDIQEYIERNKVSFGIQKEEEILECEIADGKWKVADAGSKLAVTFNDSGVSFSPEGSVDKKLFDDFYSVDTVIGILSATPSFNFQQGTDMYEMEYLNLNSNDVVLPGELQKIMDGACPIYIERGGTPYERSQSAPATVKITGSKAEKILSVIGDDVLFARFMNSGECDFFVPCSAIVPCSQFSDDATIPMDLVAVYSASDEEKQWLYDALRNFVFNEEASLDGGKLLAYIEEHSEEHKDICKEYLDERISDVDTMEGRVDMLCKLYDYVATCPSAKSVAANIGSDLYDKYILDVTLDALDLKYQVLRPLFELVGCDDKKFVADACEILKSNDLSDDSLFEAFEEIGIDSNVILSQINVVKSYAEKVCFNEPISGEKLGKKFDDLRFQLWRLNDLVGIKAVRDFVTVDEEMDETQFLGCFDGFEKAYNDVKKYRNFAKDEYVWIDDFATLYSPIAEVIKIERDAQKNVGNIDQKYIANLINKGEFRSAVCEMYVKLQSILKRELSANGKERTENLIDNAFKADIIDKEKTDSLHNLRKCRNDFQHPSDRVRVATNTKSCNEWCEIVFSIEKGGK